MSPGFAEDRLVYLIYAEAGEDGRAGTAAGRGRLSADKRRLEGFHVIFRQLPKLSSGHHFGSRLVFDGKGHLFIALGENNQRSTSQDLDKLQGKRSSACIRTAAFPGQSLRRPYRPRPEIWSYGHRNQQGAALNPWTGRLWTHEHGPRGDEINIPQAGGNYGWPLATMESTTPCCRSPKPGARPSTVPRRRTMSGRSRRRSAAWRSTMRSASRPGSITCSSARWRRRN